jgi:hypothetical protein
VGATQRARRREGALLERCYRDEVDNVGELQMHDNFAPCRLAGSDSNELPHAIFKHLHAPRNRWIYATPVHRVNALREPAIQ